MLGQFFILFPSENLFEVIKMFNPSGLVKFSVNIPMPGFQVVSLPARIDPLQTSAVVSLHGRLLVRVPFEQSNN